MRDPFRIEGPAIISFSGGRTSAYMLWRILQAWGELPANVHVCFANTGKEMPQTLDFVRDCGEHWGVVVHWLEYGRGEVNYATASRNGEPYKALIASRKYLPNPVTRFCTTELKITRLGEFAKAKGWDNWTNVIGLRADEPQRVARLKDRLETVTPLATAGITKRDVWSFWKQRDFDLGLPSVGGGTPLGNCDLCFLKGAALISGIMRDHPKLARWWIEAETERNAHFRSDRPSYAQMFDAVQRQGNMDFGDLDQRIDCFCSEDQA
jgi:3'-phosphoadenosine 5'-phosphosulfate sulfotransferase (PAPS reductase)/FAD synthetase